ncbi:MAG: sulfite exporter TauE/SafE family protein [Syntrophomonadaceae bacterium]|nr:sulfite exporter TauE/SafE family protein [Syntrophomonadaceae bacterium]
MVTYVLTVVIGVAAGILGSLLGVGGGIIMLPATQLIIEMDPAMSIGTTLFAVIFASVSGAYGHFKNGNVVVNYALYTGLGGITGVLIGSYLFKNFLSNNTAVLQLLLGLLFAYMGFRMGRETIRQWHKPAPPVAGQQAKNGTNPWKLIALGLFTGTLTGILGIGGGFIMVPAMIWLFGASPFQAVGTTLLAMFPIAAFGGLIKVYHGFVNLPVGLILGLGTVIGAQVGVQMSRYVNQLVFKGVFSALFIYLAINYLGSVRHIIL